MSTWQTRIYVIQSGVQLHNRKGWHIVQPLFVAAVAAKQRLDVDEVDVAAPAKDEDLLVVHEALDEFAAHDARKAELVKLRYFVGLSIEEAAEVLGVSEPTAKRDWAYARAWLYRAVRNRDPLS